MSPLCALPLPPVQPFVIHQGDALAILRTLPADSVDCCITSPPYWGLRDYGTAQWTGGRAECDHKRKNVRPDHSGRTISGKGLQASAVSSATPYKDLCGDCGAQRNDQQQGLERTPGEYVARMVAVFRQVRRVLCANGTLWVNVGDTYVGGGNGGGGSFAKDGIRAAEPGTDKNLAMRHGRRGATGDGLKPKDLVGIPWMLAFALRSDGWYLRADIIWAKPNPMPESVTDRTTKAHEYLFLLSKSARYFYDREAILEPLSTRPEENYPARARVLPRGEQAFAEARGNDRGKSGGFPPSHKGSSFQNGKSAHGKPDTGQGPRNDHAGRNKRSVWTLPTLATPEAHFATFPIELPETCMLAGCPEGGSVLDPYAGAGTTGLAALKNGRSFVGIELNPAYIQIAYGRVQKYYPLLGSVAGEHESASASTALAEAQTSLVEHEQAKEVLSGKS